MNDDRRAIEEELIAISEHVNGRANEGAALSDAERVFHAVWTLEANVNGGGRRGHPGPP